MSRLPLAEAIDIAEKIDNGRTSYATRDSRFAPLWRYPFLCEAFIALLRACDDGKDSDVAWGNFHNICAIMCPEFAAILNDIDLEGADLTAASASIYE